MPVLICVLRDWFTLLAPKRSYRESTLELENNILRAGKQIDKLLAEIDGEGTGDFTSNAFYKAFVFLGEAYKAAVENDLLEDDGHGLDITLKRYPVEDDDDFSFADLFENLFGSCEDGSPIDVECEDCICSCEEDFEDDEFDDESGIVLDEEWREYLFSAGGDTTTTYHISDPVFLYFLPDDEYHAVESADGVVHIVPAPGTKGCVLRFLPND
jgi:hypothetical protein